MQPEKEDPNINDFWATFGECFGFFGHLTLELLADFAVLLCVPDRHLALLMLWCVMFATLLFNRKMTM